MANKHVITILGGGPAGLAAAYYCRLQKLPFHLFEAASRLGGNAVTFSFGEFKYDSGAHRFHDKDQEITRDVTILLGDELEFLDIPSHIYHQGNLIDFPLSPIDLMQKLGPTKFILAGLELVKRRVSGKSSEQNFESYARHAYGDWIAGTFLLNYSGKVWGYPTNQLSTGISGGRLEGLSLSGFARELFSSKSAKTMHLDGSFYYPRGGIGSICDKLAEASGVENLSTESRITKIAWYGSRITAIEVNGVQWIDVNKVISTLPLTLILRLLDPAPPSDLLEIAESLRFRNMVLVTIFLDKDRITHSGTVYFPDEQFPFTRLYEPKNRSPLMAPPGKTSLCFEIPCFSGDHVWQENDQEMISRIIESIAKIGWISSDLVLDADVRRFGFAYPVLTLGYEEKVAELHGYLDRFENLKFIGRNAGFMHNWVHNMLRFGKDAASELSAEFEYDG